MHAIIVLRVLDQAILVIHCNIAQPYLRVATFCRLTIHSRTCDSQTKLCAMGTIKFVQYPMHLQGQLGHINLIVSFSFPPTPEFSILHQAIFAQLVTACSQSAAYKVDT